MKIAQINATYGVGSTGKICLAISDLLNEKEVENYVLYSAQGVPGGNGISCYSKNYTKIQALKSRIFGNYGFNSMAETRKMIRELEKIGPDVVHLHNIHGHDCHLGLLFNYFRKKKIKLFWTFHDCWAFTGYCPHFDMVHCDKWKTECYSCVQRKQYSFIFDRSRELFRRKKQAFAGLDLTIVTPSQWLANQVKQSFLKDYPVKVIHNGIDLDVFKPTAGDFRERYGIPTTKKILLGVAFGWGLRKGLDVFIELAKRLDAEKFQIVLVGTDDKVDEQLPGNIISIHRTHDQKELAEIYTAADLFVNPTREEVLGMVNIETLACGTPVLTFRTGGSPECVDETCGAVVECDDVDAMEQEIRRIMDQHPYTAENCRQHAQYFRARCCFEEYNELYCAGSRGEGGHKIV